MCCAECATSKAIESNRFKEGDSTRLYHLQNQIGEFHCFRDHIQLISHMEEPMINTSTTDQHQ